MNSEETLGLRIRRLRQERGMTLQQVAGQDFTRAFLNQVEMGKAQPSTRLLRVIANRLGAPIDYLVDGAQHMTGLELAVERARLALLHGDAKKALALVEPVLKERMALGSDARLCAAEALQALGRANEAEQLLEAEEPLLRNRGDRDRVRRVRELRSGKKSAMPAVGRERLAERMLREGHPDLALEHFRAARVLLEAEPTGEPDGSATTSED